MWVLSGFLQVNRHVYKGLYIHINHKVTLFTVEEFPAGFCCPGFFLFVFTFVQMQFKKAIGTPAQFKTWHTEIWNRL